MIYPVGDGTKITFERDWYVAQGFGNTTNYGKHCGLDINLKTGGDTDLGQPVRAMANGRMVYWHYSSHPTTGFGRHNVYKIEGPWGIRWIMNAHLSDQDFFKSTADITEGALIGRIGKSGTPYAHDHMSIWKVDPANNGGIDAIAHNDTELNQKWEDPIAFINQWTQPVAPQPITDDTRIPQINNMTVREIKNELDNRNNQINILNGKITNARVEVEQARNALS